MREDSVSSDPDTEDVVGEEEESSPQDRAARACVNCVRAKAKCSPCASSDSKCSRCLRLKKDCQPSPPIRKRRTLKKRCASKVEKLEEKVDRLVSLLEFATQGSATNLLSTASVHAALADLGTNGVGPLLDTVSGGRFGDYASSIQSTTGTEPGGPSSVLTPPVSLSSTSGSSPFHHLLDSSLLPSSEVAEHCLNLFRAQYIIHSPFLVLLPDMTAYQLQHERPLLWLCIMTVTVPRNIQQDALSKSVRAILGHEIFVVGTRNMDLLLAVLVYSIWDRRHCVDQSITTVLVQLAIAVLYDLGLDKPVSNDLGLMYCNALKGSKEMPRSPVPATMEERRALLGCFLLSSAASAAKRGEPLRWSAYCDECLRVLEEEKEVESDAVLVQVVKLRLLGEKSLELLCSDTTEDREWARTMSTFYVKSFRTKLDRLRDEILNSPARHETLLLEVYHTEISIHELGFTQLSTTMADQKLQCLWACLQATKSFINLLLSIPPQQFTGFSVCVYAGMVRSLVTLYRLSTCEHADWDKTMVRDTLDVSTVLEQLAGKFEQVKEASPMQDDDKPGAIHLDHFNVLTTKLRAMKASWDAVNASTFSATDTCMGTGVALEELPDFSMEFLDTWNW